ncbi:amidohydrolase family protein [Spirillospora sp. NPDC048819]|uniref:N-acyl-D-amino-acid deacylase family protein n=1 Tax=Spirillospora sp. NPDC048819 TaxID=3155268 RepID=UPI0033C099C5
MVYDLKISGGTIVDGTGRPRFTGDIAVKDGKIVAVGSAPAPAAREIDATGKVVCPGFIDIHTHYDVQILWDRMLTFSPQHGVTTVVMGNCGFGIAPCRKKDREYMLRTLQDVEGMSFRSTMTGLGDDWGFETYPQYLDLLERRGVAVNVATMIGHTGVRVWVMGEDAAERQPTEEELAEMHRIVEEAFEAGAAGFSTSNSPAHTGHGGKPVPSRVTSMDELISFGKLIEKLGRGSYQLTWGPEVTPDKVLHILEHADVPITDPGIASRGGQEDERIAGVEEAWRRGHKWYPQVSALPNTFEVGLARPFMFALDQPAGTMNCKPMHDLFDPLSELETVEERYAAYQRPGFREAFIAHTERQDWKDNYWPWLLIGNAPGNSEWEGRNVVDVAAELGVSPGEFVFDQSIATKLEFAMLALSGNRVPEGHLRLLKHPHLRIGLADSGAHNGEISDYRYPTYFLSHWVRERGFPLEEAIKKMTTDEAECYGIVDRGSLTEGLAADIVVFDPETVRDGRMRQVHDLPAGARRLRSDAHGIHYVIVNGTVLRDQNGDAIDTDGELPGKVLREFAGHA